MHQCALLINLYHLFHDDICLNIITIKVILVELKNIIVLLLHEKINSNLLNNEKIKNVRTLSIATGSTNEIKAVIAPSANTTSLISGPSPTFYIDVIEDYECMNYGIINKMSFFRNIFFL